MRLEERATSRWRVEMTRLSTWPGRSFQEAWQTVLLASAGATVGPTWTVCGSGSCLLCPSPLLIAIPPRELPRVGHGCPPADRISDCRARVPAANAKRRVVPAMTPCVYPDRLFLWGG